MRQSLVHAHSISRALSENELEEVAGGSIIGTIAAIICSVFFVGGSIGGGIYAGVSSSGW